MKKQVEKVDISKENNSINQIKGIHYLRFISILLLVVLISGCSLLKKQARTTQSALIKIDPDEYPKFSDDLFFDSLEQSILQSIGYYNKMPSDKLFVFGEDSYNTDHMLKTLSDFLAFIQQNPARDDLNNYIRDNFLVYKSEGKKDTGEVLFTGYYEPSLKGSLKQHGPYQYPVFAQPDDHVEINLRQFLDNKAFRRTIVGRHTDENTVVPYYTRSEIGNGDILKDKTKILAYVDSAVDLFFLEIQGSGIIYLDNGSSIRVHYHTKNGHSYKSIGAYLIRNNSIPKEEMSMQKIREYLTNHPEEVTTIFNYNTSYVFFRLEEGGPYGCYSAEVTPERSIATDKKRFPACGLAFIKTQKPLIDGDAEISSWVNFSRFVLNQDTGGAIKGGGRADIFKGNGEYAEIAAGHMKHTGDLFFLVLKKEEEIEE